MKYSIDFDHSDVVRHPLCLRLLKHIAIIMISIEVVSEDRNWSKKIKRADVFLSQYVDHFQKNTSF